MASFETCSRSNPSSAPRSFAKTPPGSAKFTSMSRTRERITSALRLELKNSEQACKAGLHTDHKRFPFGSGDVIMR
jgi:hypothetical protein